LPLCFSHGDFTHTQLLFDGAISGLVDFDTVCQAEPALDLGQFQAYLRLAVRKIEGSSSSATNGLAEDLCSQFFHTYTVAAGYDKPGSKDLSLYYLHRRTQVYEIVSLLRVALHSWQKLKESRLEQVLPLVEERILCLPSHHPVPTLPQRTPLRWLVVKT
jgi:aminoglycoside phosphotransferase (APT) family kinase protein